MYCMFHFDFPLKPFDLVHLNRKRCQLHDHNDYIRRGRLILLYKKKHKSKPRGSKESQETMKWENL